MGNGVMSGRKSVTSVRNIILFQAMSVFCHRIKGMLCSKVTDDGYICGLPSEHLQINPYGFLRRIRISEKFVCIRVQIFESKKLKNDEIFMEWYNVTD